MVYHNPHRFFLIFLLLFRRTNWNRKRTKIKTKLEFSTFRADIQTTKFWILRIWVSITRYRDGCGLTISNQLGQRTQRLKYFQWWKFWKFWYSKFVRVWELWSWKWIRCDFTRWKISRIWRNWGSVTRWNKRIEWIWPDSRNAWPFFWRWSCCWGYF